MSLTSLIDVIFLLLLFFMLTSTFSRYAEVELTAAAAGRGAGSGEPPLFLRLAADALTLNGETVEMEGLTEALGDEERSLLVSLANGVTSQRLTDLLVALRAAPGVSPTILGGP